MPGGSQEAHDIAARAMAAEADKPYRMFNEDLDDGLRGLPGAAGPDRRSEGASVGHVRATLSARCLRKYLKLLPDFDDMAAEEQALDLWNFVRPNGPKSEHFPAIGAYS